MTETSLSSLQTWNAKGYDDNARFVSDLGRDILSWLAPQSGEHILDIGCGDGALTSQIIDQGATVIGVDMSQSLIDAALARGVDARYQDAQNLSFDHEFDAVFSNAALHWMTYPERVINGVARSLKPGGRFVAEFGGHGNVAAIVTALRSAALAFGGNRELVAPWFYPTPKEYSALLSQAGFMIDRIALVPRPTPLPTGMEGWLMTFRKVFFDQFEPEIRQKVLAHTLELLQPSLCDREGDWTADYVRLKVSAHLPH